MRLASGLVGLCLLLSVQGCADLKQLRELQRGLIAEFGPSAISVNLTNGRNLTILFVNSPLANEACEVQAGAAQRAVGVVRTHYPRVDSLYPVAVGFTHQRSLGPVSSTTTMIPFSFSSQSIRSGALDADLVRGLTRCMERARSADQSTLLQRLPLLLAVHSTERAS